MKINVKLAGKILLFATLNPQLSTSFAQGTAFTYQGRLSDGVAPANGSYDLRFIIYDNNPGGSQQGPILTNSATAVGNGFFSVTLDFGKQFPGEDRWLELAVRTNGGGAFTTLSPRQALTPTPYALYAEQAGMAASVAGTVSNAVTFNNPANSFTGNGAGLNNLNALTLGGLGVSNFWKLGGNAGTIPGTSFLGTTDPTPVELRINGARALRLEPDPTGSGAPNVIGGSAANVVDAGVFGATIAGGGATNYQGPSLNRVSAIFGTIGGGRLNQVAADHSTIAGGYANSISATAWDSVIGGGLLNSIDSGSERAAMIGGYQNAIQAGCPLSVVGGGYLNVVQVNATAATIGGGYQNTLQPLANYSVIGGGGGFNAIQAGSSQSYIGAGAFNVIGPNSVGSCIAGGSGNLTQTNTFDSTISGGKGNLIENDSGRSTIAGGIGNAIRTNAPLSTISGGLTNVIQTGAVASSIGGGYGNTIQAGAFSSTISGGESNTIGINSVLGTIPGGYGNVVAGSRSFAAGSQAQALHPGSFVWADGTAGPFASTAGNQFSVRAAGGVRLSDSTPSVSFGATTRQMLNLWNTDFGIGVQTATLYFRSGGDFYWYRGGVHSDAYGTAGAGGTELMRLGLGALFVNGVVVLTSDRNTKENFTPVKPEEVLAKVAALPISEWQFKTDPSMRHIGPMAQDFYAAFNVGSDDKHIATVDADGVALAAIQGLNEKVEGRMRYAEVRSRKLEQKLEQKEKEIAELKSRLNNLETTVMNLNAKGR